MYCNGIWYNCCATLIGWAVGFLSCYIGFNLQWFCLLVFCFSLKLVSPFLVLDELGLNILWCILVSFCCGYGVGLLCGLLILFLTLYYFCECVSRCWFDVRCIWKCSACSVCTVVYIRM